MKRILDASVLNLLLVSMVILMPLMSGCGSRSSTKAGTAQVIIHDKAVKDVDVTEFKQLMQLKDAQLIDVRTPEEYAQGHIEGAKNIDFFGSNFEAEITTHADKTKPVLLYCRSGGRSGQTLQLLKEKGYEDVYNLVGGYTLWKESN